MTPLVVVAIRPDARAAETIATGAWLARSLEARVCVVYVAIELESAREVAAAGALDEESVRERVRAEARESLAASVGTAMSDLSPELVVEQGDVPERITTLARERKASLLVVGTEGRRGVDKLLVGDIADSVLRAAPCPVVVVPRGRHAAED